MKLRKYRVTVMHNHGAMLTGVYENIEAETKEHALHIVRERLKEKYKSEILDNTYVVEEME